MTRKKNTESQDEKSLALTPYQQDIKRLSDAIVSAQAPIRILDATKWDNKIKAHFFSCKFKEQPKVTAEYYKQNVNLDWAKQRQLFHLISREIVKKLGQYNPVGQIMRRMCGEYLRVLHLLERRGTHEFSYLSQELFGSAKDVFHVGDPTLAQLGILMADSLSHIGKSQVLEEEQRTIKAKEAIKILQTALNQYFVDPQKQIRVILSDGIIADAAAGADYIKIRSDATFNQRDLKILEVHEGLVHIGTTLNGKAQPICTFLSKGPPSSTITQEGLAILMEILSLVSYPARIKKISNRIRAIELAEDGATFLDIFEYFRLQGYQEEECYMLSSRVFRGCLPTAGAFTKDLSYAKGFVTVYNFLQLAVRKGKLDRIPMLFCGKTNLEDIRDIAQLVDEGLIILPKYLPPQIKDMNAIAAWMCFANFLNQLSLSKIESDYDYLLS
ncbi:MAG: flavohemoglobin expression-modulating QEGLA motif protein [Proteobacteria bacterium]|nr:flavohemoglobin expression-modulating QEGLA motif protein [Pseudomonadota bacterium]